MVTAVLAETTETAHEAGLSPLAVGLLAFTVLMGLLFTVFAFRSVGTRH